MPTVPACLASQSLCGPSMSHNVSKTTHAPGPREHRRCARSSQREGVQALGGRWGTDLLGAENGAGPLPCRLPGAPQPLMSSCIGFARSRSALVACSQASMELAVSSQAWRRAGSCPSSLRIIRLDLSGAVRVTSTGRSCPLTSGSQGLVQAVAHVGFQGRRFEDVVN